MRETLGQSALSTVRAVEMLADRLGGDRQLDKLGDEVAKHSITGIRADTVAPGAKEL